LKQIRRIVTKQQGIDLVTPTQHSHDYYHVSQKGPYLKETDFDSDVQHNIDEAHEHTEQI